jgi:hypothetical protein
VHVADPSVARDVTQNLIVIAGAGARALPGPERPLAGVEPSGRPLTDAWAPVEYLQAKVLVDGLGWD